MRVRRGSNPNQNSRVPGLGSFTTFSHLSSPSETVASNYAFVAAKSSMFLATFRNRMCRTAVRAASQRTAVIGQHMMSTNTGPSQEEVCLFFFISFYPFSNSHIQPTVKFESNSSLRTYILNRPSKLNALDEPMLSALRPKIEVC